MSCRFLTSSILIEVDDEFEHRGGLGELGVYVPAAVIYQKLAGMRVRDVLGVMWDLRGTALRAGGVRTSGSFA